MRVLSLLLLSALAAFSQQLMRGRVESIDLKSRRVAVANEPIPGGMGAMTMSYALENEELLTKIKPGDRITAKYVEGDLTLRDLQLVPPTPPPTRTEGMSLEEFERLALTNNPTAAQAQANLQIATGNARQAGLYPNPTAGYYAEEIRGGYARGGRQGGFISQTIVTAGKLSAARRAAELLRDQQQTSVEIQRLRILTSVRILFYQVLSAQRMVEVRQNLVNLASDAALTSHQLANVGQADRPDVLQAEIEQQRAEVQLRTDRQTLLAAWRALAAMAGQPGLELTRLHGDLEGLPDLTYAESLSATLAQSPEVKFAAQQVQQSQASLVYAKKIPIPDLQLSANLTQNRAPIDGGNRPIGLNGGLQVGVELPVFNRNQGGITAARGEVQAAEHELSRLKLLIERDLAALFRDYDAARISARQYKDDMLPRAQQAYQMYRTTYQKMASAWPQTLMAQRTLFQLEADYIAAIRTAWESALEIRGFGLTGGLGAAK